MELKIKKVLKYVSYKIFYEDISEINTLFKDISAVKTVLEFTSIKSNNWLKDVNKLTAKIKVLKDKVKDWKYDWLLRG